MHGKNVGDGLSNIPPLEYKKGTLRGDLIDPGARSTMLYLAAAKPKTNVPKKKARGWWKVNRIVYGHIAHDRMIGGNVPEAKGFEGSMKTHQLVGLCEDREAAERNGPLHVRDGYCACEPCRRLDFRGCLFKAEAGRMRKVTTPIITHVRGALTLSQALEEFASTIDGRQLLAVRNGANDSFWLARAMGKTFIADEQILHSTEEFDVGWILVRIKWFDKKAAGHYVLLDAEHLLNVNSVVRIGGLDWAKTVNCNSRAHYHLSDEAEERILSSL